MQLTQEYLKSIFEYNPENDSLIYKENPFKRKDWNERFAGKEVKVTISGGFKYIFVCDALYRFDQIISVIETGEDRSWFTSKTTAQIAEEAIKEKKAISAMSLKQLKELNKRILSGEDMTEVQTFIKNSVKKAKGANPKKVKQIKEDLKAKDLFNPDNKEINIGTGLPCHIYMNDITDKYYVKITYLKNSHKRMGFVTVDEALDVRNSIYLELIEAEKKGEDLKKYKCTQERKPKGKKCKFDLDVTDLSINSHTGYPNHIYYNNQRNKLMISVDANNRNYRRYAETLEEALEVRNSLYKDIKQNA